MFPGSAFNTSSSFTGVSFTGNSSVPSSTSLFNVVPGNPFTPTGVSQVQRSLPGISTSFSVGMGGTTTNGFSSASTAGIPTNATVDYVIIGAGIGAIIFANRLLQQKPDATIAILYTGMDNTGNANITDLDFGAVNMYNPNYWITTPFQYVFADPPDDINLQSFPTQLTCNPPSGSVTVSLPMIPCQVNPPGTINFSLWTPSGVLGDALMAYQLEVPPFLTKSTSKSQLQFIQAFVQVTNYSSAELQAANTLSQTFGVPTSGQITNTTPVFLTQHYRFVQTDATTGETTRIIGTEFLNALKNNPNVIFYGDIKLVRFTSVGNGVYTVNFIRVADGGTGAEGQVTGFLIFKSLPIDTLRIATIGGISDLRPFGLSTGNGNSLSLLIPAVYRAVIPINAVANNMHLTFSLPDKTNSTSIAWIVDTYTNMCDPLTKQFAQTGKVLLIVEAANLANRRQTIYSTASGSYIATLNGQQTEQNYFCQFLYIVKQIKIAMTGDGSDINATIDICSGDGICQETPRVTIAVPRVINVLMLPWVCNSIWRTSGGSLNSS